MHPLTHTHTPHPHTDGFLKHLSNVMHPHTSALILNMHGGGAPWSPLGGGRGYVVDSVLGKQVADAGVKLWYGGAHVGGVYTVPYVYSE